MTYKTESSRILVKNIPKYITKERLKAHFQKHGDITDIKIAKTKDGRSRQFAYIGFKTDKQGLDAVAYFNNTYIDTCKLEVTVAKTIGDVSLDRPWSKYSKGSSANEKLKEEKELEESKPKKVLNDKQKKFLADIDEDDDDLKEFLEVMRPRQASSHRTWGNDDVTAANAVKHKTINPVIPASKDDDLYQDLLPMKSFDDSDDEPVIPSSTVDNTAAFDSALSDLDYLKMKMNQSKPAAEVDKDDQLLESNDAVTTVKVHPGRMAILKDAGVIDDKVVNQYEAPKLPVQEAADTTEPVIEVVEDTVKFDEAPPPETIADTGRIMVRNLAYSCTHEDLEEHFGKFGPIAEVTAFTSYDKSIFQGRILEIVAAKEKPKALSELPTGPQTFKAKREQEKKAKSTSDFNWNSLFMNSDAVAEAMARKMGVRKSEILDADTDNMAVRLALAETHVIAETKQYLENEGVSLEAFTGSKKNRSHTIILVKNIPSSTEEHDLRDTFGKFGTLGRVLLPPSRTIAIVEYSHRNEAKAAFSKLSYSKFKNLPLYLEYAPAGTFISEYNAEEISKSVAEKAKANAIKIVDKDENETLEGSSASTATVFVKNLNFSTTDSGLKAAFEGVGGLRSARISTKANPKDPKNRLSMGFGFLEFNSKEDAMRCIKGMQKFILDGHELSLKFSTATTKQSQSRKRNSETEAKENSTKLLVRNLPFEATKKDLKQLFSSFGSIKTVRVPRKFDGQHRGFGFVDFLTTQEAQNAYDSLGATHLYGRHLVIEWAKEEETVEEMREKTGKAFVKDGNKKRKMDVDDELEESYD
ncbi:hypothetical protein HDV02_002690 [Globomyces sp. JEL0801]|nr:hypothetical protein HDV02_002690 [Globomyces sp. JEL0801]